MAKPPIIDSELLSCALEVVKEVQTDYLKKTPLAQDLGERTLLCFAREVIKQSKLGEDKWLKKKFARANQKRRFLQKKAIKESKIHPSSSTSQEH